MGRLVFPVAILNDNELLRPFQAHQVIPSQLQDKQQDKVHKVSSLSSTNTLNVRNHIAWLIPYEVQGQTYRRPSIDTEQYKNL